MEREALLEPALLLALRPGRRLVEPGQLAHRADRLRPPGRPVAQRLRLEEPASQHLRHVLALDRLNALLPLPAKDVEEIADQPLPLVALLLRRVGGKQRRHHRRPVHLGHCLRQVLEEVDDAVSPHAVPARLLPRVHEDLVDQDQRAEAPLLRAFEQPGQQRLRRRRFALLGAALAVNRTQPVVAVELVGQHAPRVAKRTRLAIRRPHPLDAAFDVDLVEAERRGMGAREPAAGVLPELANRSRVRQGIGRSEQVVQRNERVRLAAAVRQLQLAHGLVALPAQPRRHVLDQLPQGVGRVGQREELLRFLVHRPLAALQGHLVQVRRELGEREFAGAQFVLQRDDLVPGSGSLPCAHTLVKSRSGPASPASPRVRRTRRPWRPADRAARWPTPR